MLFHFVDKSAGTTANIKEIAIIQAGYFLNQFPFLGKGSFAYHVVQLVYQSLFCIGMGNVFVRLIIGCYINIVWYILGKAKTAVLTFNNPEKFIAYSMVSGL